MSLVTGLSLAALQGVGGQKKVLPQIRDSARMAVEGNEAVTRCGYFSRSYDKVLTEITLSQRKGRFDSLFQRVQSVTRRTFKVLL